MDETVLKAYGWEDINLAHDFYAVDYLPENDRVLYTISPEARKEILKRLLKLNHEIHEQEVRASLHIKGKNKKPIHYYKSPPKFFLRCQAKTLLSFIFSPSFLTHAKT